jgi:hypothetical protein
VVLWECRFISSISFDVAVADAHRPFYFFSIIDCGTPSDVSLSANLTFDENKIGSGSGTPQVPYVDVEAQLPEQQKPAMTRTVREVDSPVAGEEETLL